MATTAEPNHHFGTHARSDDGEGLGHGRARPAASPDGVRAPRASARRRRDQDHLRRHLPFRPAHLPATTGAARAIRASRATRSSAPSPPSATKSPATASATRSPSAAWSTAAWSATSAWKAGKSSAARAASRPTTAPTITTARFRKGGYTDHIVVRDHFCCKVPGRHGRQQGRAFALRRHHDLLAASPVQCRAEHEGRRRRASAALVTWA